MAQKKKAGKASKKPVVDKKRIAELSDAFVGQEVSFLDEAGNEITGTVQDITEEYELYIELPDEKEEPFVARPEDVQIVEAPAEEEPAEAEETEPEPEEVEEKPSKARRAAAPQPAAATKTKAAPSKTAPAKKEVVKPAPKKKKLSKVGYLAQLFKKGGGTNADLVQSLMEKFPDSSFTYASEMVNYFGTFCVHLELMERRDGGFWWIK